MNGLDTLKDELNMITKTKNEIEKRLQTTVIERETIFASLEEALDRIHTLERHVRELETKLQNTTNHLDRVQQENSTLNERLVSVHRCFCQFHTQSNSINRIYGFLSFRIQCKPRPLIRLS